MRVAGLDLSLAATGVAANGGTATVSCRATGPARLAAIRDKIMLLVGSCDLVVIEGYAYGARNSHAHALGELGGVIRLALWENDTPYVDVPPAVLKKYATGKGNADKNAVLAAAIRRLDYDGSSGDEADAMWLRAMGVDWAHGIAAVPGEHRAVLGRVEWPDRGAIK